MAKSSAGSNAIGFGCLFLIAVVFLAGFLAICAGLSSCGETKNTSTTATNTAPVLTADPDIQIGDEGHLDNTLDTVLVAHTQDAIHRLIDAENAKDTVGMQEMVDAGDAFFINKGTKVKLIGYGDGFLGATIYHVRFEEGPRINDDGWTQREFMKK